MTGLSRRQLLLGGLGLGATLVGGRVLHQRLQPAPSGHSPWFQALSQALHEEEAIRPALIIDQHQARANLQRIVERLRPQYGFRVVAKSLPSLDLLEWVMQETETRKLMLFNEPFLRQVTQRFPEADVLMGKPLNVSAARHFHHNRAPQSGFNAAEQLQWLIDTPQRLAEYEALAEELDTRMRLSIEIDVGLHRGGVEDPETLRHMVTRIGKHPLLDFSGLMGYEAHVVQAPGKTQTHFRRAMERYQRFTETALAASGLSRDELTLNTGGSTTYSLYPEASVVPNELAIGSAIVQPADFDLPTLAEHKPAAFIAAPLLKSRQGLRLPGAPGLGKLMALWDRRFEHTFFIDRGNWKARPHSPETLRLNPLYGRSSNQDMVNAPAGLELGPGDYLFFRPTQSEAVLRQFGDLLIYDSDSGKMVSRWRPFTMT